MSALLSLLHKENKSQIEMHIAYCADRRKYDFSYLNSEQAAAELAAMQERIKELETAMLSIEFDETTGECLLGCGGDSVGGHTDDCVWWKNDTFRGVSNNRLDNS